MSLHINVTQKWPNFLLNGAFIFWISSLIIAPIMAPPNTVRNLDGCSIIINHMEIWEDMDGYPRMIYFIGDIFCHQNEERSFIINRNQMPICTRCFAVYIGFLTALCYSLFIPNSINPKEYFLYTFPKRSRMKIKQWLGSEFFPLILIGIFLLPVILDGGIQLITSYESTNLMRVITGLPAGWLGGILLGAVINT